MISLVPAICAGAFSKVKSFWVSMVMSADLAKLGSVYLRTWMLLRNSAPAKELGQAPAYIWFLRLPAI